MNKIYKVIWSKAKHTYVVTSEIAKSHAKAESTGKGLKKLAIVLLAVTALLGSGSYTYAADSTQVGAAELKVLGKKYGVITGTNEAAKAINEAVQQVKTNTTQIANNSSTLGTVQKSMTALEKKVNDMGSTGASKTDLEAETKARDAADKALDSRTSDLEAKTEAITYDKDSKTAMVDGKLTAAEGITDGTTKDGQYVKMDNYVGQNLNALDTQVKSNADDIATVKGNTAGLSYDEGTQTTKVTGNATVTGKTTMDSASVTNSISVGHNANVGGAVNAGSLNSRGNLNVDGNALVKGTLTSQSTINGKEIVSQTNITAKNKVVGMQGVVDNTLTDGTYVTAGNTVGQNINALDDQVKTNAEIANQLQHSLATEATAREAGDTALNDRITAVKESLQADASVQDGAIVKAGSTIGENVQNLDTALAKETAARIGADKAQDAVIQQVNENASKGIATLATAYNNEVATREAADNELNERITNEANAIHETTNQLQSDLSAEAATRESKDNELNERITNEANAIHDEIKAGDNALNDRITAVKESLQQEAADTYVSKDDASVEDGYVIKKANKIGENVALVDKALSDEVAARVTADKAQNEAIATVNSNLVTAVNTINQNMSDGFTALNQADANEAAAREAADNALDSRTSDLEAKTEAITYDKDSRTVMVDGKLTATEGITDGTTQDGQYVKMDNYVGQNLNALDQGLQA